MFDLGTAWPISSDRQLWHENGSPMITARPPFGRIAPRLFKALHAEALAMAKDSQRYFEGSGKVERELLDAGGRVAFACESLKVSTRLMQVVAWLLVHQTAQADQGGPAAVRLQDAAASDARSLALLPPAARLVVFASQDLYERVRRLDGELSSGAFAPSPARGLLDRLARSL